MATPDEIRLDDTGDIDEVCLRDVDVHIERMGWDHFWMGISRSHDTLHLGIFVPDGRKRKLIIKVNDDEIGCTTVRRTDRELRPVRAPRSVRLMTAALGVLAADGTDGIGEAIAALRAAVEGQEG